MSYWVRPLFTLKEPVKHWKEKVSDKESWWRQCLPDGNKAPLCSTVPLLFHGRWHACATFSTTLAKNDLGIFLKHICKTWIPNYLLRIRIGSLFYAWYESQRFTEHLLPRAVYKILRNQLCSFNIAMESKSMPATWKLKVRFTLRQWKYESKERNSAPSPNTCSQPFLVYCDIFSILAVRSDKLNYSNISLTWNCC